MNAGGGAEGIGANHGIIGGDPDLARARHRFAVCGQRREILIPVAHHHQVDQQQVKRRVPAPFADAERSAVQPGRPGFERRNRRRGPKAAVLVPVPVDADVDVQVGNDRFDERHECRGPVRRGVADRVRHAHPGRPGADRGREQRPQRIGIGARRVLGDVHHREALLHREGHGVLGALLQKVEAPSLRVLPDRAGADEGAALDRHAGALDDLGDWLDIRHHRPRRAVALNVQLVGGNRTRQPLDVAFHVRTGSRQADVDRVDLERVHAVQDFNLLVDGRGADGRRLQAVAQRLVVEHCDRTRTGGVMIPVVDQRVGRNAQVATCPGAWP